MADLKDNPKKKNLLEINNMTIAEQLKVKDFPFEIKDSKKFSELSFASRFRIKPSKGSDELRLGKSQDFGAMQKTYVIYYENSDGFWSKKE